MKLQIEKIRSYVGFAIKSRHICYGTDEILKLKNDALVLISSGLGEGSKNKIKNHIQNKHIEYFEIEENEFKEIVGNKNILAFAIKDKHLSEAISENIQK